MLSKSSNNETFDFCSCAGACHRLCQCKTATCSSPNYSSQEQEEQDVALEERIEEIGIETDVESSTDRFTVGDFEPIISPDYVA